jgi:hypothetical protein
MPYASWDSIKCNNTLGIPQMPYGSWDSKLGCMGYALCRAGFPHLEAKKNQDLFKTHFKTRKVFLARSSYNRQRSCHQGRNTS